MSLNGVSRNTPQENREPDPPTEIAVLAVVNDVVDGTAYIRELEGAGYRIRADFACSKHEFTVRLRAKPYDLVLADFAMPGWTALDLVKRVKEIDAEVPVVVLTGVTADELVVPCVKAGAADYIHKQHLERLPIAVGRALNERKSRQERTLADQTIAKLRTAVDQSPASIIFTDTAATIQYVNRRFCEVTGYSAEEAVGKTPRMLHSGRNTHATYNAMWSTIRSGQTWRGEIQNRRKNGEIYWDSVSISPIRDANGVITNYLGCQEDITERKRAEERIRDSEERFRQLADNTQEVFFVAAASLREMLYISPAYETVWGRSCESLYKEPQSFIDAVPTMDKERVFAFLEHMQRGETPESIEYRVVRPDGSTRWVLVQAAPIRDAQGKVYRLSGSALDITDRHLAQDALKESETRFKLLIEASFDGISIVSNGKIVDANTGLADMLGYSMDDLIGRPVTDLVDEESVEFVRRQIGEGIDGAYEFTGRHKDGHKMMLEAAAKSHLIDGQPGRLAAVRDVTERRNLETQFRQAQKMEAVGRLAGGVAHDFNNLLTVIMTYSQMLSEGLSTDDPRLEDVQEIMKASTAAASLTRQLLAFSRQQVIEPRLVMLDQVVAGAEKMIGRLIGEDITVECSFTEHSAALIDPGQLEQVLMNLAVNARDAMPTGGKLTIETSIVDLDDTYAKAHWPATPGRFAMLAVTDTGVGMTPEIRARIFEPFFTTKEVGKGTGLGLATVYGIVKQSNGFIWVYSEPGLGTTFKLYFPLAAGCDNPESQTAELTAAGGTETVLIVEDSPPVRAAAQRILQQRGYRVLEAPGGEAAIALAAAKEPQIDLLLTDVVMPGMSGRQVANEFKRLRPNVKVLYMSGYTDDAVVRHGILQSGLDYLQKPFTGETLSRKVRAVLTGTALTPHETKK